MERYGIRGLALEIFTSYLRDRTHRVRIGKTVSDWLTINIGVPQGSLVSPIFFLIFINDLVNLSCNFLPILYADDTTLLFSDQNAQNLITQCNSGLTIFHNWSISNKLSINEEKTYCMAITLRSLECYNQIRLNGKILEFKNHCKFLGMTIDNKLKFNNHSDYIASKISKSIGVLYRIKDFVPRSILIKLYNTLILPYLSYCISIWGGTCDTHTDQIIKLQKRALRIICNKSFREHTNDLFISCSILKFNDIYRYNLAVYFYKSKQYENFISSHNHFTRNRNNLVVPFQRLSLTQHSVSHMGASVWNSLPLFIRSSASVSIFKARVKKHFLDRYAH